MRIDFNGAALAAAVILFSTVSPSIAETPRSTAPLDARSGGTSGAMTQQAAPSRRVGQLSLVLGRVDFRGPDDGQWSPGVLNDPVATGVALRTDPSARLEIRIGPDRLDLASGTEIAIIRLEPGSTEIALRSGRIELDLGRFDPGESVAVDTARGGVWLGGEGRYDVDAGADGHGLRIVVYAGSARFAGGGADLPIAAGNRLTLDGSGPVRSETESASPDAFAQWCARRAVDDASLAAPYFVSREMTGYAALDAGGDWVKNSAYARSGCRTRRPATGRLIATATGGGWRPGDGAGSTIDLGVLPPRITAGGGLSTGDGRGCPASSFSTRYGRRRLLPFSARPRLGSATLAARDRRTHGSHSPPGKFTGRTIPMTSIISGRSIAAALRI